MTLVASFRVKNWPVLVGDIMISAPEHGQEFRPFNIPTHGNVNARLPPASERIVSGLEQKAIILIRIAVFSRTPAGSDDHCPAGPKYVRAGLRLRKTLDQLIWYGKSLLTPLLHDG